MTTKRTMQILSGLIKIRKTAVRPDWKDIIEEYEELRKSGLVSKGKAKDTKDHSGWYSYEITKKGERLHDKLATKKNK
ncbi:MAG: hypothetical protein ACRCZ9_02325 [Fusobacteriaceae bacterium]